MMIRAAQAIVFDFGGVFTLDTVSRAQLRNYDALLGLPPGTLHNRLYSGEAWERASTGQVTPEAYWIEVGQPYEQRLPPDFRLYRRGVFQVEPINEAVVDLARLLRERYPLALCSNALLDLPMVLDSRPDIRDLFDVVVVSSQVGLRKPDPDIYRLTVDQLGLPPEACLFIDDKRRNTDAAAALGMTTIVFESAEQLASELQERGILPAP